MSYEESDILYEKMMDDLYAEFKEQFEDEFIHERMCKFYKNHRMIAEAAFKNLHESTILFGSKNYSSAFMHAIIAIEVGIKSVIIRPMLYSLAIDNKVGDLLFKYTFKNKSLPQIPKAYYEILKEIMGLDFESIKRQDCKDEIRKEWDSLQEKRNEFVHQGIFLKKEEAENAINMASYVCGEILPSVLDKFYMYIENGEIKDGCREFIGLEKAYKSQR